MSDNYLYEIRQLKKTFYLDYPNPPYIEILKKEERAYNCLLLKTRNDYFICIPYRSNIKHSNSFHFKRSKRSKLNLSGLDYSKVVIIKNLDYLKDDITLIDKDEYIETLNNMDKIVTDIIKYIDDYINHYTNIAILDKSEYRRKYSLSTLQYFHQELNI